MFIKKYKNISVNLYKVIIKPKTISIISWEKTLGSFLINPMSIILWEVSSDKGLKCIKTFEYLSTGQKRWLDMDKKYYFFFLLWFTFTRRGKFISQIFLFIWDIYPKHIWRPIKYEHSLYFIYHVYVSQPLREFPLSYGGTSARFQISRTSCLLFKIPLFPKQKN